MNITNCQEPGISLLFQLKILRQIVRDVSAVLTYGRPLGFLLLWAPRHTPPPKTIAWTPAFGGPLLLGGSCSWWAPAFGGPLLLEGPCSWWAPALGGALLLVGPCSWWAPALGGPLSFSLVRLVDNAALLDVMFPQDFHVVIFCSSYPT